MQRHTTTTTESPTRTQLSTKPVPSASAFRQRELTIEARCRLWHTSQFLAAHAWRGCLCPAKLAASARPGASDRGHAPRAVSVQSAAELARYSRGRRHLDMSTNQDASDADEHADKRKQIAENPDDPRVWVTLRPAPESDDEYELLMASPDGTNAYKLPYSVGGLVIDEMLSTDQVDLRGVH